MGSATPSQSGDNKHKGTAAGGRPGPAPKTRDSRGGGVRASEGTNPCTRPSFATKNVFDVLQDLFESIGGSPGPQLDAADGQPEPIVHDLHQSLVVLPERPEILTLHAVGRVGRERQLHLKVRALCGDQDAKGQPMPHQRWPTEFHYVDGGLEQADTTDFVCVNRIIAEPWRQCSAVSPVDIAKSENPLTEEDWIWLRGKWITPFTTGEASVRARARTKPGGKWTRSSLVPMMGIPS